MANEFVSDKLLAIASEATTGTDAIAPLLNAGSNNIVYQRVFAGGTLTPNVEFRESNYVTPGPVGRVKKRIVDGSSFTQDFPAGVWRIGNAAPVVLGDETPYYAAILRAAGGEENITAGTSAVYEFGPNSGCTSFTAYCWSLHDRANDTWRLKYALGLVGSLSWRVSTDEEPTFSFTGTAKNEACWSGQLSNTFDGTTGAPALFPNEANTPTTYDAVTGTPTHSCDETPELESQDMLVTVSDVDGNNPVNYKVSGANYDLGFDITTTPVVNSGVKGSQNCCTSKNRTSNGTGQLVVEDCDELAPAYEDAIVRAKTGKLAKITITYFSDCGETDEARVTHELLSVQMQDPQEGERNGQVQWTIPFEMASSNCSPTTSEPELRITYDRVP